MTGEGPVGRIELRVVSIPLFWVEYLLCGVSIPVVRYLPKVEKPVRFWYPAPIMPLERRE